MDGVLCDSEPFIAAAAAEMLRRRYGITATREDFLPFVGAGEDRFISGAAERHGVTVDLAIDKPLTYEIYLEMIPGSLRPIMGARDSWPPRGRQGSGLRWQRAPTAPSWTATWPQSASQSRCST
jgi:hypothetical protein